nr:stefin 1 [Sphaerospora molnari]
MSCGSYSSDIPADDLCQQRFDHVRSQVLTRMREDYDHHKSDIKIISCQKQVVSGINYKIKYESGAKIFEAVVFEALPCHGGEIELTAVNLIKNC